MKKYYKDLGKKVTIVINKITPFTEQEYLDKLYDTKQYTLEDLQ